ncbi:large neutral amino acids transporter small subunit 2-like isoform X2 [Physella acuta]|uniref:large neutral amino acids transporter small subunit 2-like isoform X2 n=1 Tax=Physella acuta TaxID=109671 RepID=UPI0027DC10CE|nr:large neutral amino acids transporter small subunit 2-like isoform X2 [Physella acuta]XP_059156687.1 large neutral amino acids transporter small subunit 2-like isoform X2 [Physella acuta]XP_059156689.1 large neutral amino acids transporter small subunit 2-like isoform X2 [Physella acuta]
MSKEKEIAIESHDGPVRLKKQLGVFNGVAMIVGIIVGSGIFVSPKGVLLEAGSVGSCLLIWAITGVVCGIGAMCYAELGTCITKSGADYSYIKESIGDLPAFLYLWVCLAVIVPTGNAITALTFANYILQPGFPNCGSPDAAVTLLAALCLCLLTFINCTNVAWATRVQDIFTFTKILALVIIIITGIVKIGMGSTENFQNVFEGSTTQPGRIALAFYSGLFSYSGWNYLNFVTEEMKEPYKNLPRAIWISLPLVTVIYILANVAYFAVMTPAEMLASDAVAVTFADRTLGVMSWIMPVFVACSTFGSLNGAIFTSSRLFFVGARHGHLPGFLATITMKHMTPLPALLFGCVTSLIMLSSNDIYALINYASFVETLFIGMSVTGLLILRVTQPHLERPIKVNLFFPVFYFVICVFLIITPLTSSPMECLMGLVMIATGIPIYMLGVMWERKPRGFRIAFNKFSQLSQKLFYSVHEELKED